MKHAVSLIAAAVLIVLGLSPLGARELFVKQWSFDAGHEGWIQFKNWPGKLEIIRTPGMVRKGKGALSLTPSSPADHNKARVMMLFTPREPIAGCRFLVKGFIAGKGVLSVRVLRQTRSGGKELHDSVSGGRWELTPQYQEITFDLRCSRPGLASVRVEFNLEGEQALFDDFSLVEPANGTALKAQTRFTIVPSGSALPPVCFTSAGAGEKIRLFSFGPALSGSMSEAESNKAKEVAFPIHAAPANGEYLFRGVNADAVCEVRMAVLPEKQFAALNAAADKIRWQKPMHILYLGDSLSDFLHDHNYTDKVNFFLNRRNQATFRNAAVHGDFVTRMLDRMNGINGPKKTFKQFRYNKLWDEKYDLIFIWLGHNDTVSNTRWSPDLTIPRILPPEQKKLYAALITEIRRHSNAPIVLVSAASANSEQARKLSESMNRPDKMRFIFARPELLEQWNKTLRAIAAEHQCRYFDVYTPLAAHPAKNALFSPVDGIHPTDEGHNFLTGLFLDYLSQIKH